MKDNIVPLENETKGTYIDRAVKLDEVIMVFPSLAQRTSFVHAIWFMERNDIPYVKHPTKSDLMPESLSEPQSKYFVSRIETLVEILYAEVSQTGMSQDLKVEVRRGEEFHGVKFDDFKAGVYDENMKFVGVKKNEKDTTNGSD